MSLTMNLLVLDGSNPLIKRSMHALLEIWGLFSCSANRALRGAAAAGPLWAIRLASQVP